MHLGVTNEVDIMWPLGVGVGGANMYMQWHFIFIVKSIDGLLGKPNIDLVHQPGEIN